MNNLFTIAENDASVQYLADIFGSMNGVLLVGPNVHASYGQNILGAMFKTFNSTVLVVAALMLIYVTVVGVMATAHEGEFMGKKWNNIWIPIRSVLGIVLLVPTSSGYSVLQIIMMWVILQGVGAADTVWNTALKYVDVMGSVYTQSSVPAPQLNNTFKGLFQGLVCDATARVLTPDPTSTSGGNYFCAKNGNDPFCNKPVPSLDTNTRVLILGPNGSCGTLVYCDSTSMTSTCMTDPGSLDCMACKAQLTALQAIVQTFDTIATNVAAADLSYRTFYASGTTQNTGTEWVKDYCSGQNPPISGSNCCMKSTKLNPDCTKGTNFPKPMGDTAQNTSAEAMQMYWQYYPSLGPSLGKNDDFIATATSYMMNAVNGVYASYISDQANNKMSGILGDAQAKGWIFAGGYYWNIANHSSKAMNMAVPEIDWSIKDSFPGDLKKFRNNYTATEYLISASQGAGGAQGQYKQLMLSTVNDIRGAFKTAIGDKGSNPLLAMQVVGAYLLLLAQELMIMLVAAIFAIGIIGFLNVFFLGTGFDNPLGSTAEFLFLLIMPALYAFFGYLIVLGGLLAIYIPLIPYIIFTFGAIAWLISVIVALVAAPLVALGVISPSGQHELLGKAEPALMLLFGIFLRPALMIFGLIAAMLLSYVVIKMINTIFWPIVFPTVGLMGAILSMILSLGAYVMLLVAALNKTFSLINVVPQQVMSWIGGQAEGVEAPLDQIKGGIEAVGGEVKGGAAETKSQISGGDERQKRKEKTKAKIKLKGNS